MYVCIRMYVRVIEIEKKSKRRIYILILESERDKDIERVNIRVGMKKGKKGDTVGAKCFRVL